MRCWHPAPPCRPASRWRPMRRSGASSSRCRQRPCRRSTRPFGDRSVGAHRRHPRAPAAGAGQAALIGALRSPDRRLRREVCRVLDALVPAPAAEVVDCICRDEDLLVRLWLPRWEQRLRSVDPVRAVELRRRLAADPSPRIRQHALTAVDVGRPVAGRHGGGAADARRRHAAVVPLAGAARPPAPVRHRSGAAGGRRSRGAHPLASGALGKLCSAAAASAVARPDRGGAGVCGSCAAARCRRAASGDAAALAGPLNDPHAHLRAVEPRRGGRVAGKAARICAVSASAKPSP
jgi:hypothetical protein